MGHPPGGRHGRRHGSGRARRRLAGELSGDDGALADWARKVVRDPNATTLADVERVRAAVGLGDREIQDGQRRWAPGRALVEAAPEAVRRAVS